MKKTILVAALSAASIGQSAKVLEYLPWPTEKTPVHNWDGCRPKGSKATLGPRVDHPSQDQVWCVDGKLVLLKREWVQEIEARRAFEKWQARNPGKTMADFNKELDAILLKVKRVKELDAILHGEPVK